MSDCTITNDTGAVISRSRNLRGVREFAGKHGAHKVSISELHDGGGQLIIEWHGARHIGVWADYTVLRHSLRNWRNLYGADLVVNGKKCGEVSYQNPELRTNIPRG